MTRRLLGAGHECVVNDVSREAVEAAASEGAIGTSSLEELVSNLPRPRVIWLMLPAAATQQVVDALASALEPGDVLVDGGNSRHRDDIERARQLEAAEVSYVDVGVSGGIWGRDAGYCLMIGGRSAAVQHLDPVFRTLAPGVDAAPRTGGRTGPPATAELGYFHCGPPGSGHFVKMVHNGIEYGLMAAYAEGLNILHHANADRMDEQPDAETAPAGDVAYRYDLDLAAITEVWRRGSVIRSWLLDLTARALLENPDATDFSGRVADSGEGRWALQTAVDQGVPTPVLGVALANRFASRGNEQFANKIMSAMRYEFGGHEERKR